MPNSRIYSLILGALLLIAHQSGISPKNPSGEESAFGRQYQKLESLQLRIHKLGATESDWREMRTIRDYYLQSGDSGARFLITKLDSINDDERRFLGTDEMTPRVGDYFVYLDRKGESHSLKYAVAFILSDAFVQVNTETKTEILKSIASSYTPSSYGQEDRQFLDIALLRTGRPSIPYLIKLASRNDLTVRCGATASLTSIGDQAKKAGLPSSPKLSCDAATDSREMSLREWKTWWDQYGEKFPFPQLPSFFDMPHLQ